MKKTIKDVYIVSIVNEGGNVIKLNNDLSLDMAEREGNSYVSFFNLVKVEISPEGSMYKPGKELLVHHYVSDQKAELYNDKDTFLCYTEQIMAFQVYDKYPKESNDYIKNFQAVDGYLTEPRAKQNDFSDELNNRDLYEVNSSITFQGDVIEYLTSADYELYYNETLFFYVKRENCFLINDEANPDYLEIVMKGDIMTSKEGDVLARDNDIQTSVDGRQFIQRELIGGFML